MVLNIGPGLTKVVEDEHRFPIPRFFFRFTNSTKKHRVIIILGRHYDGLPYKSPYLAKGSRQKKKRSNLGHCPNREGGWLRINLTFQSVNEIF
jgi:hypothetical protein